MKTAFIWREKPNSEKFSSVSRYIVVGRILQLNQIITVREWFTVIEQHESYERITFSLLHWETLKVVPMTFNLHPGALKRLARSCRTTELAQVLATIPVRTSWTFSSSGL